VLGLGSHAITAAYGGGANVTGLGSSGVTQAVN
jgi:hypothetical protein